jgi:hypothetical protein
LDRSSHGEFKIVRLRAHRNNGSAQLRFFRQSNIGAKAKNRPPQKEVGLDAQERLAKSHKAGYVKNGIWCELMQLHTIEKQKPTEKFVGRKG